MPCVAVVFDTAAAECRRRNAARPVSVAADVVANQLRRWPAIRDAVVAEPWDQVLTPEPVVVVPAALARRRQPADCCCRVAERLADGDSASGCTCRASTGPADASSWVHICASIAADAEAAGVDHIWMMDHLRQIPQVGAAWADLPEPYTALSWLAAVTERVRLGVLVSPAFRHHPAVLAKQVATLDVLSGGRAMCGLGVGWFAQEYEAAGIEFPSVGSALRASRGRTAGAAVAVGQGLAAVRGRDGRRSAEALCYPRPIQEHIPMIVGGSGERRTLRLVAQLRRRLQPVRRARRSWHARLPCSARHCSEVGRDVDRDRRLPSVDDLDRTRPRCCCRDRSNDCDRSGSVPNGSPATPTPARWPITTSGRCDWSRPAPPR